MAKKIGIYNNHEQDLQRDTKVLQRVLTKLGLDAKIDSINSWEELLRQMGGQDRQDIIVINIRMPGDDGKELIGAFSVVPSDKLAREEELENVFTFMTEVNAEPGEMFEFIYRRKPCKIALKEIRCFESHERVIHLHGPKEKYYFYAKLDDVEKKLADSNIKFVRVNKSFLVNVCCISEYRQKKIVLNDGSMIGIGRRYKDAVRNCWEKISTYEM